MQAHGGRACLVEVLDSRGSVPRGAGAWMAVLPAQPGCTPDIIGTIGGGHLEWQAMREAAAWLQHRDWVGPEEKKLVLGASLGQCCGGAVRLRWQLVRWQTRAQWLPRLLPQRLPVALFGAGHVGQALVRLLQDLPCQVQWMDSREDCWHGQHWPAHVQCLHQPIAHEGVADVAAQSRVYILTHSHDEDLQILQACLQRQRTQKDLHSIGLIGSATKWASFRSRLRARGWSDAELDAVICPIGVAGVQGKEPQVIAVAVAAQILQTRAVQTEEKQAR